MDLDKDATKAFGKETTTLRKLSDGRYVFYVHINSESYMHEAAEYGGRSGSPFS